ncbi:MAG: cation diffusion facilitator family transporter, partial [Anaerolineae bacterium]
MTENRSAYSATPASSDFAAPSGQIHRPLEGIASRSGEGRKLVVALGLTGVFVLVEVAGGVLTGSLALIADAGHMFVDFAALLGSFLALRIAQRSPTERHTFGLYRAEILAALANGATLILITLYVVYEAAQRILDPAPIDSLGMLAFASVGLVVNLAVLRVLRGGESLNIRSALVHVLGDTLSSIGIIVGGLIILVTGMTIVDPLLSLGIALLILWSGYRVTKDAVNVLLEATPAEIDLEELAKAVQGIEGVQSLHDVHLWSVTSGLYALSAHLLIQDQLVSRGSEVVKVVEDTVREQFGIAHTTLQVEAGRHEDTTFLCCLDLNGT